MTEPFELQTIPLDEAPADEPARFAFSMRPLQGPPFTFVLHGDNSGRSATDGAAILADLFRPGWRERCRLLRTPVVREDALYRGFEMARRTSFGGQTWRLSCLVAEESGVSFDWERVASDLDSFFDLVCGEANHA